MQSESAGRPDSSKRYAYFVFTLLFLLYMFDYIDRMVVVSLFPFIKADWGLSDAQLGLLVSAVYWSILVFTLPTSILVDRWSRKYSVGLMATLWSLATAACALTRSFPQLFAARTAVGLGEAGYAPGGAAMLSALFPEESRARVQGLWNASIPLGSALGIALGGLIAQHWGWRHAFGLVALPGMIVALLFFRVKDYRTVDLVRTVGQGDNRRQVPMKIRDIALAFAANRTLLFNNLAFAACTFVTTSLLSWLPSYFNRLEGMAMDKAGLKSGSIMLLAIIGAPLGGWLADRWRRRTVRARLLLPALSSLLAAILLWVALGLLRGDAQYPVLLLCGVAASAFIPSAVAVTQDVVHPGLRAVSLSINIITQHILGSSIGPVFIGYLSDRHGLAAAMTILPAFSLVAAVLFFIGSFFYAGDLDRVEKVEIVL
ncbi:MAG: MFS transporter [Proteobacteria bacterium]|nr:MFS transporter [Pseudomonadota bacterium]